MNNKLKRMKAELVDKFFEENYFNCKYNFGNVCARHSTRKDNGKDIYGKPMEEVIVMFPEGCEDFGISLDAFIKQEKMNGR